jgi:DNA-binding helix-hairpin-helix protein with protein kinase domain
MNAHDREAWNRYHADFREKVARAQKRNPLPPRDPAERINELLASNNELLERARKAEHEAAEWQRVAIASQKAAIEAHEELLAATGSRCVNTADMFEAGDAGC